MKHVFLVTFGRNTLRDPRIVGVFSTKALAQAACERDFEAIKAGHYVYVSSTDYDVIKYIVDVKP